MVVRLNKKQEFILQKKLYNSIFYLTILLDPVYTYWIQFLLKNINKFICFLDIFIYFYIIFITYLQNMGLFDDDVFEVESESHDIFQEQEKILYNKWIEYIKAFPKIYSKTAYKQTQIHNFEEDIDDVDVLTFSFTSYDALPNTILCPLEFIIDSPRYVNFLSIDDIKPKESNGVSILWYTFREYHDNTFDERKITSEDIEILSVIKYPENSTLPVKHIIIRATFDSLETYILFVSKIHGNFPNTDIHIHYDSRIYISNVPVGITSVFYTHDVNTINADCNVDIVYQSFPVNGAEIKYQFKQ